MTQREAFEATFSAFTSFPNMFLFSDTDGYQHPITRTGFAMWMAAKATQPEACTWTETDDEDGIWSSSCGELWSFIDGGPKENRVSYCHNCGKKVEVKP